MLLTELLIPLLTLIGPLVLQHLASKYKIKLPSALHPEPAKEEPKDGPLARLLKAGAERLLKAKLGIETLSGEDLAHVRALRKLLPDEKEEGK